IEATGISTTANFFTMGGNSINIIKLLSMIKKSGYEVSLRDIYNNPSIKSLSPYLQTGVTPFASTAKLTQAYMLPGNRSWYFDGRTRDLEQWGVSYELAINDTSNLVDVFEQAIATLLTLHEGLRAHIIKHEDTYQEALGRLNVEDYLCKKNLSECNVSQIDAQISVFKNSLDMSKSMIKFLYCDLGEDSSDRIIVLLHHFLFDQYSVNIVLRDFMVIFSELEQGRPFETAAIGGGFSQWVRANATWLNSKEAVRNIRYWESKKGRVSISLPTDYEFSDAVNTIGNNIKYVETLSPIDTNKIAEFSKSLACDEFDVIIAAMSETISDWIDHPSFYFELVVFGRDLYQELDLSEAVGWMNEFVPVHINIDPLSAREEAVLNVKSSMQEAKNYARGFNLLKYKPIDILPEHDISNLDKPEFAINYVPRNLVAPVPFNGNTNLSLLGVEEMIGEKREAVHKISCQIQYSQDQLELHWHFGRKIYHLDTIKALSKTCVRKLLNTDND
ncbi:condensation domain-containing protein, partial [Pseudoalteromonas sp. MMG005]|uniref:condensation domain-containing protein n=1 Tax=Pseudoalteromonas sp. MMG005 TaxID=2822682 RepID=UPI001B3A0928